MHAVYWKFNPIAVDSKQCIVILIWNSLELLLKQKGMKFMLKQTHYSSILLIIKHTHSTILVITKNHIIFFVKSLTHIINYGLVGEHSHLNAPHVEFV